MEEHVLRCNNHHPSRGYCRAELKEEAIVTTCSHVICRKCASETGLLNATLSHRVCPTCKTPLPNQDDAATARLSPSEDYKTSVLSGLDPTTIMECAGRALAFWNYQASQEIAYQKHMLKALSGKYTSLSGAMDKMILEANGELGALRAKATTLDKECHELQRRNEEIISKDREKVRKYNTLRQMYEVLKKKYHMAQQDGTNFESAHHAVKSFTSGLGSNAIADAMSRGQSRANIDYNNEWKRPEPRHTFDESLVHRQQLDTSGRRSTDASRMPPPSALGIGHDDMGRPYLSGTPLQRAPLPGSIRQGTNHPRHQVGHTFHPQSHDLSPRLGGTVSQHRRHVQSFDDTNLGTNHPVSTFGLSAGIRVGSAHGSSERGERNLQSSKRISNQALFGL